MDSKKHLKGYLITQITKSGYFRAPDGIFGSKLSTHAKLVLLYLCRRADNAGFSFPSKDKIARDCGVCRRTADKVVNELISFGLIEVQQNIKKSNQYKLDDAIVRLLKGELTAHEMPGYRAGDAPIHAQEMPTKENTYKENTYKEKDQLDEFEVFFKEFRETNRQLGRENSGDKRKAFAEYLKLRKEDKNKLLPYLALCRTKKSVADAIRTVKMDKKDPEIQVPQLSWLSDCQRFLKNREWESKNIFDVKPVLHTDSDLQKKHWEKEGYVEDLHFNFINAEVDENVA